MCGKQHVSPPFIHSKSRMRKRARTDLRGGRSAMVVPTATVTTFHCSRREWPVIRTQSREVLLPAFALFSEQSFSSRCSPQCLHFCATANICSPQNGHRVVASGDIGAIRDARIASRRNLAEKDDSSGAGFVVSCKDRASAQPVAVRGICNSGGGNPTLVLGPR